ncbi:MAG: hypothetical protein ACTS22_10100 [Phycisphaerales bacterium]
MLLRCATEFEAELRASTVRAAGVNARVIQAVSATINLGAAMGTPYEVYVRAGDLHLAREALAAAASGHSIQSDAPESEYAEPAVSEPIALGGGPAFAIGMAVGLLTVFIPYTLALLLKAPLSAAERNIFGILWVVFFGMVAYTLRERFPIASRGEEQEHDDGVTRTHFRDSRIALAGWFLLGAGFLGPASFFFVGLLLLPLMQALATHTTLAQPIVFYAWCVFCGIVTANQARKRRNARREARSAPRLAR